MFSRVFFVIQFLIQFLKIFRPQSAERPASATPATVSPGKQDKTFFFVKLILVVIISFHDFFYEFAFQVQKDNCKKLIEISIKFGKNFKN